ncbi:hypothetical protein [Raineya orbicola]|jgi:hypothetical protein|uniref:6-bladed beta-propeller n=1 Tax=Raineya orbicola TaxID=2016530 RepID=A0A2N3I9D2_9BACT|nr:hypothetical protein [Raineya orbicola]PKQ66895.1 hypothetical protein Rain11_2236 [Raineya orbicola]
MNRKKWGLFFILLVCSCNSQDTNTFLRKELNFEVSQKILLQTEHNYPGLETALFGFLKNDSITFSFIAGNLKTLLKYDKKGNLIYKLGKKYIEKDFQLPNLSPVGFDFYGDTTFLLFPNKNIFKIHQNKVIKKITLQVPSDFIISRSNIFYYIPKYSQFILSCGKNYENMRDYFSKNSPISLFDADGNLVKNICNYPKEYVQDGKYFHTSLTTTKGFIEKDYIYLFFDNFSEIFQYDLSGNLIKTIKLPESKYRNTTFKFSKNGYDELSQKEKSNIKNDAYIGGISKVKNKDIFFYSFYSHQKNKIILCKYDLNKNIFSETILPPIASFISLFPNTFHNDKVYFLSLNSQSDDVYIYEVQMD